MNIRIYCIDYFVVFFLHWKLSVLVGCVWAVLLLKEADRREEIIANYEEEQMAAAEVQHLEDEWQNSKLPPKKQKKTQLPRKGRGKKNNIYIYTPRSKYMAQSRKGRLIQGLYKPIHGNCAIYFYPGVSVYMYVAVLLTYYFTSEHKWTWSSLEWCDDSPEGKNLWMVQVVLFFVFQGLNASKNDPTLLFSFIQI